MAKVAGLKGQIEALHKQVQEVEVRRCCWLPSSLQGQTWSCHPVAWMGVWCPHQVHATFQASC